jgi:hypothetical protein
MLYNWLKNLFKKEEEPKEEFPKFRYEKVNNYLTKMYVTTEDGDTFIRKLGTVPSTKGEKEEVMEEKSDRLQELAEYDDLAEWRQKRFSEELIGKTIEDVEADCLNIIRIYFTDETHVELEVAHYSTGFDAIDIKGDTEREED